MPRISVCISRTPIAASVSCRRPRTSAASGNNTEHPMPKTNGTQYDSKKSKNVHTKVCIIGSGPAGITAAWHLLKNGVKDVTLIEGSRTLNLEDSRRDKKYLYDGKADGLFDPNEKEFLLLPYPGGNNFCKERERIFGGTSAHWAGQCRPLDKITFEERAGFPGWPIKRTDLDPYYAKASAFLELYGNYYDSNQKTRATISRPISGRRYWWA
jgi:choline dehydrogenase-like flavoprotein